MVRLSVNINKVATLRNARGGNNPDVIQFALDCEKFGAQGITVHPRPDERHIRRSDVISLSEVVKTEFNIEGYPDKRFLELVKAVKPAQATLVPDPPDVLTSNAGWDTRAHKSFLQEVIHELKENNIRPSIFLDPNPDMVSSAHETGTSRIELYTEAYARGYEANRDKAIDPYIKTAELAHEAGLGINAGHDLDLHNLEFFAANLPNLMEVSIGHALICDALYSGLENTIQQYLKACGFYVTP
jgi:pyridoxine 5-phosphate synthase